MKKELKREEADTKSAREQSESKVYIMSMERYGDREGHHYNCGTFFDLADAVLEGLSHERFRANKYEMRIEFSEIGKNRVQEIPRETAISYAKLKYPEKFNDKSQLIEDEE